MNKFKERLSTLPVWIFTILTTLLILWLTLSPDPLGDDTPTLFPGADKLVHGIMFGFLTVMIMLDRERKSDWKPVSGAFAVSAALASLAFGIVIEFIQRGMDMGRGFEVTDMIADSVGALICAAGWFWIRHFRSQSQKKDSVDSNLR